VTLSRDDVFWLVPVVAPLDAQPIALLNVNAITAAANDVLIFISPALKKLWRRDVRAALQYGRWGSRTLNNETNTYIDVTCSRDSFLSGWHQAEFDKNLTQNRNNSFVAEKVETAEVVRRLMLGCFAHSPPRTASAERMIERNEVSGQQHEPARTAGSKRKWIAPALSQLPRLSDLTLQSPINGGGGPGGGGSTVVP
jgi:hypothetical protein